MDQLRQAAQQALEALEELNGWQSLAPPRASEAGRQAAINLRAALEQPERCSCGDRPKDKCPGEWEPGCDLGNNPVYAKRVPLEQPEQAEPVAWACFKNGELQTELVGTEADVDFWCASGEPEMQGMVKGALYTHPPRREPVRGPQCNPHPNAPHGFLRNASHTEGRYVCACEYWQPYEAAHGIKE